MSTQIPTDSGRGYPNKSTGNISSLASLHSLKTTMPGAFVDAVRRQRNTSFELTNSVSTGVMSGYVGYVSGIISGLGRAIEYIGQVMSLVNATEIFILLQKPPLCSHGSLRACERANTERC
ncbi:hypothetical protein A0H81_01717 [Grifola frondosa]|uniref:Uncharacterized protein n=1 Tax=Grifola frondosa TaxID=5627 RepID=A0A1C7MMT0_GRIFR|nr:hypothetical protein A0H81_01717 [Grifola frondosa]